MINYSDAAARLAAHADITGIPAPAAILDAEGAPTDALLAYCDRAGLSLDWLFRGKALSVRYMYFAILDTMGKRSPGANEAEEQRNAELDAVSRAQLHQMLSLPIETLEDLAIAVHVGTCGGEFGPDPELAATVKRILAERGLPTKFPTGSAGEG